MESAKIRNQLNTLLNDVNSDTRLTMQMKSNELYLRASRLFEKYCLGINFVTQLDTKTQLFTLRGITDADKSKLKNVL